MNPLPTLIHRSARCSAPPEEVFHALVTDSVVEVWMTAVAEIEPHLGGRVEIKADGWIEMKGEIVVFEPPGRLELRWETESGTLSTTIDLTATPDGTLVTLEESGFGDDDELCRVRDNLWNHWLIRLAAVVGVRRR